MNNPKNSLPNGWSLKKLGEIVKINSSTLTEKTDSNYSFFYLDLSSVKEGKVDFPNERINFHQAPSRARRILKKGDIIIATVRPNLKGFALADFDVSDVICSTGFALISSKNNTDAKYIYQSFYGRFIETQIENLVVGSNYPAINNSDVENLLIQYPQNQDERVKIATILGTWDAAIQTTTALLAALQKRKKGLMQRLLSGNVRLKGFETSKWQMKELEDMLIPTIRTVHKPNEQFLGLGLRSHGKGTFLKYDVEPDKIEMDTLYEVKQNDLIVNITFAWEGAIAIAEKQDEGALVSHRFPTYTFNEKSANSDYFKHFIKTQRFRFHLVLISPGGAGRNRVMSKKDFLKLEFKFPPLTEQTRIAAILNAADAELRQTEVYLEKLKTQKRGLMQQLLTGKVRVNQHNGL